MIKWIILLSVAIILWIVEYRQELNDIRSEFDLPEIELVPFWNRLRKEEKGNEKKPAEK